MIALQRKFVYYFSIFFLLLLSLALFSARSAADESHSDPSGMQRSSQHHKTGLVLQNITENALIVNDERYVFNNQTQVKSYDPEYPVDKIKAIPYPALVNLVYQTYTQRTEAVPYQPGTRVVERITFLQKFESDGQNSQSGKQD